MISDSQMIGVRYGFLIVLKRSHQDKDSRWHWLCKCDCGKTTTAPKNLLDSGGKQSCGNRMHFKHRYETHGKKYTRVYRIWKGVKSRATCKTDRDYPRYGGAGIGVDPSWLKFENFYRDMGSPPSKKHQIDRINNKKGYSKENCRWATPSQQSENRSNSKLYFIDGMVFPSDRKAAEHHDVTKTTIRRWCNGFFDKRRNSYTPPKINCHMRNKYQ